MKILVISPRLPFPLIRGDRLRTYNFIKELAKSHEVDLCTFYEGAKDLEGLEEMKKYCGRVETVLLTKTRSYVNMILGVFNFKPFQVNYYNSSSMRCKVREMTKMNKYDIVHIVLQRMMPYASYCNGSRVVLDQIDALSMNFERRAAAERNIIKKALFYYEHLSMKRYEKNSRKLYSGCIVSSDNDKKALPYGNIKVVPNGVDLKYFTPQPMKKDIDVLFVGNMGYFPNVDAVMYFCEEVLPKVKMTYPDIKVHIVGARPSTKIRELNNKKNITVTGYVEDVREYLNRAKIFIAPMRSGSGIQNKILEAMAMSVPVITTSYGNSGINAENNKGIIIADDPVNFAQEVSGLLNDPERRYYLSGAGKLLVETRFSWDKNTKDIEKLYLKTVRDKKTKVLLSTEKKVIEYNGCFYTDGGSPSEFLWLNKKVELHLVTPVFSSKIKPDHLVKLDKSIQVHSLGRLSYFHALPPVYAMIKTFIGTAFLCKRYRMDLVIAKGPREIGMTGVLGAKFARVPSVYHHSLDWMRFMPLKVRGFKRVLINVYRKIILAYRLWFTKLITKNADTVATVSNSMREELGRKCGINSRKIALMTNTFTLRKELLEISPAGGTPHSWVLYLGRIDANKNVSLLLKAVKLLADEGTDNFSVSIVGDGPGRENCIALAKKTGISDRIEFPGYVPNYLIGSYIKKSTVLVLPSFSEVLPNVVIEAMASARPVIGSDVGGMKELVEDGVNGYLIDPMNERDLADKLKMLIADKKMQTQMGEEGRKKAQEFLPNVTLNRWMLEVERTSFCAGAK